MRTESKMREREEYFHKVKYLKATNVTILDDKNKTTFDTVQNDSSTH